MQSTHTFRPMQTADLDTIALHEPQLYSHPWTRGNFADALKAGNSCWVMMLNNELIGYAVLMMVLDEAQILNVSIVKSQQRRGYGRLLMEKLIDVSRQYNAIQMFLEVRVSNSSARQLYDAMGFNEISIRRGYYPAAQGREDAVLMAMAL